MAQIIYKGTYLKAEHKNDPRNVMGIDSPSVINQNPSEEHCRNDRRI